MHNFPWLDFPLLVTDFPSWGSTKTECTVASTKERSVTICHNLPRTLRSKSLGKVWQSSTYRWNIFWDCHVKCLIVFTAKRKSWSTGWSYNLLMKSNKSSWLGNKGVIIGRQHICFFAINHLEPLSVKTSSHGCLKPLTCPIYEGTPSHPPVTEGPGSLRPERMDAASCLSATRLDEATEKSRTSGWFRNHRQNYTMNMYIYIYIIYLIYWLIDLFIDLFHFSFMYWSIYSCTFLIYWLFSFI